MDPMALTDDLNGDQPDEHQKDRRGDHEDEIEVLALSVPIINV